MLLDFVTPDPKIVVYAIIFIIFVQGIASSGRFAIGYCLLQEYSPEAYHTMNGTIWAVSEGAIYLYLSIYYRFISRNWMYPIIWSVL